MLIELLVDASTRLLAGLEGTLEEGSDDTDTLCNLIAFHLDFALAEGDIIRIQDRELAHLPAASNHRVRQLQRRYIEGWSAVVARLRPTMSAAEREVRMHAVFGILNSTPYTADASEATNVRAVLAEAALVALLGSASDVVAPDRLTVFAQKSGI
jgi:hypothetical protein